MERLVKSHIAGLTNYTMAQMAIHETKKVLRREIKKRVAAMTDDAKLKESTSIVSKVSSESSIFRTSRYLRELKQAEKRYPVILHPISPVAQSFKPFFKPFFISLGSSKNQDPAVSCRKSNRL